MTHHPLEDEDVLCTVVLEHVPTGVRAMGTIMAPADGGFDISEATDEAQKVAMDELLAQIEQQGG